MKKKTLFILLAALALMSALVLSSCNGEKVPDDETTVPETTVDLSAIIGVTRSLTRDDLGGCTPFIAESADPSVVEARVMDREIQLTATGAGTAAVKVKNTYGEDFEITVTCDPSGTISFEGEYKPVENSVNVKDFTSSSKMSTTEAIQAAIDSLPNGGTVYIPRGLYVISQIRLKQGIRLRLEGLVRDYTKDFSKSGAQNAYTRGDFAVLRTAGSGDLFLNNELHGYGRNGCSDFEITGGVLDMQGKVRCFVWCCAEDILLKNVILKDCPNNHAIQVTGCKNVRITECMFAGYNYGSNNTTAEVIQVEQTHPGAIGAGDNPAIKFDAGEYFFCSDVEISNCYFGKSDRFDAPTYAIGHHGQSYNSAVTGIKITGCVFDNCRCSAIRYPGYSDVEISGNTFISNRDNSVSPESVPGQINIVSKNSDIKVNVKNKNGTMVSAYYAKKFACIGSVNTVIENNEFIFGTASKMRAAVIATSNTYDFDATYETGALYTNWYTETAYTSTGYRLAKNRIENLTVRGNKITVDANYAGNGYFFQFTGVIGLACEDNTVEGKEYNTSGNANGVKMQYTRAVSCTHMTQYQRKYAIMAARTCPVNIVLEGTGGMTLRCTASSEKKLILEAESGRLELTTDSNGVLHVTPVADEGKVFAGYKVTSGSLAQNGSRYEFSAGATITAYFKVNE